MTNERFSNNRKRRWGRDLSLLWKSLQTTGYLLSFPKCGRTWLGLMLNDLLANRSGVEQCDPTKIKRHASVRRNIPRIRVLHDDKPHQHAPEELSANKFMYYPSRVLFLYRDPRDVMVSLYFHSTKRKGMDVGSMADFVWRREGGLPTLVTYYNVWSRERHRLPRINLLSYEDLLANPYENLDMIARFFRIPRVTEDEVRATVDAWEFKKMQEKERNRSVGTGKVQPRNPGDLESFKARKGKAGGFVDYMEPALVEQINTYLMEHLDPFYTEQYTYATS